MTVGKVQPNAPAAKKTSHQQNIGVKSAVPKAKASASAGVKAGGGLKSISLKNLAQKVQQPTNAPKQAKSEKKPEEPIDPTWNEVFSQEKLDEEWRRFTRLHDKQPRIHTIYKNHPPQLTGGSSLLIKVRNKTQEYELNKERSSILSFLRRSLKNAKIDLSFEISQEEETGERKAFTVADKYKVMSEKNPALLLMRKAFNLDLE